MIFTVLMSLISIFLDLLAILGVAKCDKDNENHLRPVLKEYGEFYNHARPHQGIGQRFPISVPRREQRIKGPILRRDILGGVIHDYHRQPSSQVSADG